jgi:pyrroline-5-carboxylate reductase
MLTKKTIGFIGAGNMAEALIKGLLSSRMLSAGQIIASEKRKDRLVHMAGTYEIKVYNKNYEVAKAADVILLTIKPPDLAGILADIAPELNGDKLLISVVAGKTTDTIRQGLHQRGLRQPVPVVRAMPNIAALAGVGAIGVFAGSGVKKNQLKLSIDIFTAVGKVVKVEDEDLMDAVTGLSGSGPAYVFLFMEALVEAGVRQGLPVEKAGPLVMQTTLGSARLALESGKDLAQLRDMVTSPGGTTIEGLKKLEQGNLRTIVDEAVEAATKRAKQLSRSP